MSQCIALSRNGVLMLGIGLTHAELREMVEGGKSKLFDLEPMETFSTEPPKAVMLIPGRDEEELTALFAPFVPRRDQTAGPDHDAGETGGA